MMESVVYGCLVCKSEFEPSINFGRMPIANGFLTRDQFATEYFFELKVGMCPECKMVQLGDHVAREQMFHENYAFFSSTSLRMAEHFERVVRDLAPWSSGDDPFVVEIGSNDGIMLRHFAKKGVRHLGVEPSRNVAAIAIAKGVNTISEFFDESLAGRIIAEHGHADVCFGANVMCHIPYMHSVAAGIKRLLKPGGVLVFEDPYLGDIVEKTSYDQIYDEHAFYFSLASVENLFDRYDMEVVDAIPQEVHGGSMRYVVAHRGAHEVSPRVVARRRREEDLGLGKPETLETLRGRIEHSRDALMDLLDRKRAEGKRIVGYGATSKSTTVTNFCGITPEHVEFICDTTPIKQGKFSPGAHIPVRRYEDFTKNYPDYALLLAWNHSGEIMEKERGFRDAGGRFILYVPEVRVVE